MDVLAILIRGGGDGGPGWLVFVVIGLLLVAPVMLGLAMRWWDRR